MRIDIHQLIRDYLDRCTESIAELRKTYNYYGVFYMRPDEVPRSGILPSGRAFQFHGNGCRFKYQDVVVDMDFGRNGETNGFEPFRVYESAKSIHKRKCPRLEAIEAVIDDLAASGEIIRQQDSRLYFFKSAV